MIFDILFILFVSSMSIAYFYFNRYALFYSVKEEGETYSVCSAFEVFSLVIDPSKTNSCTRIDWFSKPLETIMLGLSVPVIGFGFSCEKTIKFNFENGKSIVVKERICRNKMPKLYTVFENLNKGTSEGSGHKL